MPTKYRDLSPEAKERAKRRSREALRRFRLENPMAARARDKAEYLRNREQKLASKKASAENTRAQRKQYRRERNEKIKAMIRQADGPCVDRHVSQCVGRLEWDHERGPKCFSISQATRYSIMKVQAELLKVVRRCQRHHLEKTEERRRLGLELPLSSKLLF